MRRVREAGEAALRAWPPWSCLPSAPPVAVHCRSRQVRSPSAREGGSEARLCAAPGMLSPCSFSSGLAAASPATPGPCRPAETALPSHPAPHQNKHSHCQRATGACNEKQVSPRDPSAMAVQQLGVTTMRAGEGWGHCRAPPSVQLPGPITGDSSHLMPWSQETVTARSAPSQASGARELWSQLGEP